MQDDPAERLSQHPRFKWVEGMRDQRGRRVVDLELWDGGIPDLEDLPTGGALLGLLDEIGVLTDVVREPEAWIVAVELPVTGLQGWAADSLGEAATYALLATYDAVASGVAES